MLVRVDFYNGNYTIVDAPRIATAERWARWEFGNSNISGAKKATKEDIVWYKGWNGIIHKVTSNETTST